MLQHRISVIHRVDLTVTIPFEFALRIHSEALGDRDSDDPARLAHLFSQWSLWWAHFALDLAAPEQDQYPDRQLRVIGRPAPSLPREGARSEAHLWDLVIAHPSDLVDPGGVKSYLNHPRLMARLAAGEFSLSDPTLGNTIVRRRRPGPDEGVAYALAAGVDEVVVENELFCVGIPLEQWDQELRGKHPFDFVVFEVGFDSCRTSLGSGNSAGRGYVHLVISALAFPLFVSLAAPPVHTSWKEHTVRQELEQRIPAFLGTPCDVTGYVQLDLAELTEKVEGILVAEDHQSACFEQAALATLGLYPGPIDGDVGNVTKTAREQFKTARRISGASDVVYKRELIRALRGLPPL